MTSPRILRMPEVESAIGLKKNAIYRRIRQGQFPQGFPICGCSRTVGWLQSEIEECIRLSREGKTWKERYEGKPMIREISQDLEN